MVGHCCATFAIGQVSLGRVGRGFDLGATEASVEELRRLEESLWKPESRLSPEWMDGVLADGFVEIGASGRLHDRNATVVPTSGSLDVELPLPDFWVRFLAPDVALVTYLSVQRLSDGDDRRARRSSIWTLVGGGWRLAFHQGTLSI